MTSKERILLNTKKIIETIVLFCFCEFIYTNMCVAVYEFKSVSSHFGGTQTGFHGSIIVCDVVSEERE